MTSKKRRPIEQISIEELRSGRLAVITVPQAGLLLGLDYDSAYEAARGGRLPGAVRLGERKWVVRVPVFLAWLDGADEALNPNRGEEAKRELKSV